MADNALPPGIARVLVTESEISRRVTRLAEEILASVPADAESVLLLSILSGAFMFTADLMRALHAAQAGRGGKYIGIDVDFMRCESYAGESRGELRLGTVGRYGVEAMSGRHVIVIDDIIDSGKTMEAVLGALSSAGCASVSCCCLLSKQARRITTPERCLVGFEIEDAFVIGYGLDYDEAWRHLPFIAVMTPR